MRSISKIFKTIRYVGSVIFYLGSGFLLIFIICNGIVQNSGGNLGASLGLTINVIFIIILALTWFVKWEERKANNISKQPSQYKNNSTSSVEQERLLRLKLIDGEFRFFQNYYINGTQYTFGFPKSNCSDKRVWVGRGTVEIERISQAEAQRRISNLNSGSNSNLLS